MTVEGVERLALGLSVRDRIDLTQRLSQSLEPDEFDSIRFEVPPPLAAELERRLAEFERNPQPGRPW